MFDILDVPYDIDVAAKEQAEGAGMAFARIESLNVMPSFIACPAETARRAAVGRGRWAAWRSGG